jgi:hypothetical protein
MNKRWSKVTAGIGLSRKERLKVLDGYHTPRIAVIKLLKYEKMGGKIWEPANGHNRIAKVLKEKGHKVFTSDIKRWCKETEQQKNFFKFTKLPKGVKTIVTNPPFYLAHEFVLKSLELLPEGGKLCLLLRVQFLEGQKRKSMFQSSPPIRMRVFSKRLPRMHKFGHKGSRSSSVLAFAWFIWIKGNDKPTKIYWI